jgi:energy-converting hydrogenase Eha subunit A
VETLEELERRKKELELRRDIARLERQGRIFSSFDPALIWAVPLIAAVSFVAFVIIDNNGVKKIPSAVLGVLIGSVLFAVFRRIRRNQRADRDQ